MNKKELQERLTRENIPKKDYSLTTEFPDDAYCLHYDNKGKVWEVYYTERGMKIELQYFRTEEEACDYFYKYLIDELKRNQII